MVGRCGSNRPPPASRPRRSSPRRRRSSPGRWPPKPTRRPRRRPSTAPGSTCCRPRRRRRSPATTASCWSSGRPAPARPACSAPPPTTSTSTGAPVFGVAPTAKAARTLERDTGIRSDTVAKLLHEWHRTDRPPLPEFQLPAGTTLIVDEAGMLSTPALHQLVTWRRRTAGGSRWSVTRASCKASAAAGCSPSCAPTAASIELERLHRFTHAWEAAASLLLRCGDPSAFDAYEAHGRIIPGTLDDHLARMADTWIDRHAQGQPVALVASTNDHVDAINRAVQRARLDRRPPRPRRGDADRAAATTPTSATSWRPAATTAASPPPPVNRSATGNSGPSPRPARTARSPCPITADTARHLAADYVRAHVRLGYAATEHGCQSDTVDTAITLASPCDDPPRPVRRRHPGQRRERDLRHHRQRRRRRGPRRPRGHRRPRPSRHPRRHPAAHPRPTDAARTGRCARRTEVRHTGLVRATARRRPRRSRTASAAGRRPSPPTGPTRNNRRIRRPHAPHCRARHSSRSRRTLDSLQRRADEARWNHAAAQRRLDASPRRSRRTARRDLDEAQWQLDRAASYVERVRERVAPSVDRYQHALADRNGATRDLHLDDTARQLDAMTHELPNARRRLAALDCWQRWASGHDLSPEELHDTVEVLTDTRSHGRERETMLGRQMIHDVGLTVARPGRASRRARRRRPVDGSRALIQAVTHPSSYRSHAGRQLGDRAPTYTFLHGDVL